MPSGLLSITNPFISFGLHNEVIISKDVNKLSDHHRNEVTIGNKLEDLLNKSGFCKILALPFAKFHGLKSRISSGTKQIRDRLYNGEMLINSESLCEL